MQQKRRPNQQNPPKNSSFLDLSTVRKNPARSEEGNFWEIEEPHLIAFEVKWSYKAGTLFFSTFFVEMFVNAQTLVIFDETNYQWILLVNTRCTNYSFPRIFTLTHLFFFFFLFVFFFFFMWNETNCRNNQNFCARPQSAASLIRGLLASSVTLYSQYFCNAFTNRCVCSFVKPCCVNRSIIQNVCE